MQAIVVARPILEQQRRRPCLSRRMAALEIVGVVCRIALLQSHLLVPAVRHLGELRIERGAQRRNCLQQRVDEVLVFPTAEAVPRHDHAAAVEEVFVIARGQCGAFVWTQQRPGGRTAERIELRRGAVPVEGCDTRCDVIDRLLPADMCGTGHHNPPFSGYGVRQTKRPPDIRRHNFVADCPEMRPNTVAVSRPLPERYPEACEPETPTAAPPAANKFGNGLPFWRSTRPCGSIARPPWVWNSAPVT